MSRALLERSIKYAEELQCLIAAELSTGTEPDNDDIALEAFIADIKDHLAKPLPDPIGFVHPDMFAAYMLEQGFAAMACKKPADIEYTIPLYAEPPASKLTKHDAEMLKCALEKLISVAEKCDSWESFPSKALDEAYAAIDSCSINRAI
jgi:hypothetical protein